MRRTLSFSAAVLLLTAAATVTSFAQIVINPGRVNFKGDSVGMSLAEFKVQHGNYCSEVPDSSDQGKEKFVYGLVECSGSGVVSGNKITVYKFLDGKLYAILFMFPRRAFEEAVATVTEKYGREATTDAVEYQNSFGYRFSGLQKVWRYRGDVVILTEHIYWLTDDGQTSGMMMLDPIATKIADKRRVTAKPRNSAQSEDGQLSRTVEFPLGIRAASNLLITRMAERNYQLQSESEHLLTFSRSAGKTVRFTLVGGSKMVSISVDKQAPQDVIQLLHKLRKETDPNPLPDPCVLMRQAAQDRVHEYGRNLMKQGCYPKKAGQPKACNTYWKQYREKVAKEQVSLPSYCDSPLDSLTPRGAN